MTDSYLRRTVLAAAGVVLSGTGLASGSDETEGNSHSGGTTTQRQEVTVSQSQSQTVNVRRGTERVETPPCTYCTDADGDDEQQLGTLQIFNRSTCQRKVTVQTTGKIALGGEQLEDQTLSIQVPPKAHCVAGFTGSMVRLDAEHGDLDITIQQRSESEAHHCEGEDRIFRD